MWTVPLGGTTCVIDNSLNLGINKIPFPFKASPKSLPTSGLCRASQVAELFPTISPEVYVREARVEDCWEVAETHCSSFFPEYSFPLDFVLRIDRLIAMLFGFSIPIGCQRTCLVAVVGSRDEEACLLGTEELKLGGFDGRLSLNKGYVTGVLTVDTVADFLPRKGPLRQRRVAELLKEVDKFRGTSPTPDAINWKHHSDRSFSVRRIHKLEVLEQPGGRIGPWTKVSKSLVPSKVKCFTWLVTRKACLTHEVLQKRGMQLVSRCYFCTETADTNSHLFLHCRVTAHLWSLFFSLTGNSWTMPEHTADLLSYWIRRGGSKSQKKWWRAVPSCIWWTIWKERNGRCFEDKFNTLLKIKWNCIANFHFWCKEAKVEGAEQLADFLGSM